MSFAQTCSVLGIFVPFSHLVYTMSSLYFDVFHKSLLHNRKGKDFHRGVLLKSLKSYFKT